MLDAQTGPIIRFSVLKGTERFIAPNLDGCYGNIPHEEIVANRSGFFSEFGIKLDDTVWMHQDHNNKRLTINESHRGQGAKVREGIPRGDMMMTDTQGLTLVVRYADCIPLVVHSPCGNAVMVIHAGWKGLLANHVQQSISNFVFTYGEKHDFTVADIVVHVGPFLDTKSYEFNPSGGNKEELQALDSFKGWRAIESIDGIPHLNMGLMLKQQLGLVGVSGPHFLGIDTYTDKAVWSCREALRCSGSGTNRDDNIAFIQCA